jgi:hypothetical protein
MTYWPISSPSVFAASKPTSAEQTRVSSDGIEDVQHESGYGGVNGGTESQIETETETVTQGTAEVKEEDRARPQQRRASSQLVDDDIHGDIVAVRVTRSGHLFATLTRTTLTVWQTKACLFLYLVGIC